MRFQSTHLLAMFGALLIVGSSALAGKGEKTKPQDLQLSGTVVKEYVSKKGKDGKSYNIEALFLKTEKGKIRLPQPKLKNKDGSSTGAIKLNDFINQKVNVKVTGWTRTDKKGGESYSIYKIVSMQRVTLR